MSTSGEYRRSWRLGVRTEAMFTGLSLSVRLPVHWKKSSAGGGKRSATEWTLPAGAAARWSWLQATGVCLLIGVFLVEPPFTGPAESRAKTSTTDSEPDANRVVAAATCSLYSNLLQKGDELWIISTRQLGCPSRCDDFQPMIRRLGVEGWEESSLEQLSEASPMATVVCVHGNRFTHGDAVQKGIRVYQVLGRGAERPTMRFIIWSWPSERVRGPYRDARIKAERANIEGYYVACFITRLPSETPLGFIGHSFGARVVGGALQALGTGRLLGVPLAEERLSQLPLIRVAFLAAAIDGDIFLPGREYAEALSLVDQLLVLYNPLDPVLKFYALLDRYRRPRALGAVGMPRIASRGEGIAEVRQRNVASIIRHSHDDDRYYSSSTLMADVRQTLLESLLAEGLLKKRSGSSPEPPAATE
jgi:hypothetical protein